MPIYFNVMRVFIEFMYLSNDTFQAHVLTMVAYIEDKNT